MPVNDAVGDCSERGIALGWAQLHNVMGRHLVRRQRHAHTTTTLHDKDI